MVTKALSRIGQTRVGLLMLAIVAIVVGLGTYFGAGRVAAKASSPSKRHASYRAVQHPIRYTATRPSQAAPWESKFGPPPNAAGFAVVLVSVSNAFAKQHGDPTRLSNAHCVEASRGHYMCSYLVSRPRRAGECHLVQAHWAQEPESSFTIVVSGRVRRCGSLRDAIRTLS
jgi:hypothetical protein